MTFDPGNRLIAAIDVPTREAAQTLIDRIGGVPSFIKIGLELFIAEGPGFVAELAGCGHRIMLDLKLHDIPVTVQRAVASVASLGVELLTVHVGGGRAMLEAAQEAAQGRIALLGVTVLTSMDDAAAREVGLDKSVEELVVDRAQLASHSGLFGVVSSPREAASIREAAGPSLYIVTPGVRPLGSAAGDQKRIATPAAARTAGADMVVVGRPIRDAQDPAAAARAIALELVS